MAGKGCLTRRRLQWAGISFLVCCAAPALAQESSPPDFQQVLAAPDDVNANLAYARAQAQAGHLLGAAAALERILLVDPNENGVRLFYVAVLFRLNDLQGAGQQLNQLDGATLTPLQKSEAAKYRDRIARGRSDLKFSGDIAAGLAFDSDALGALHEELDFFGTHPKQSGDAAVVSGFVNISEDLDAEGDLAAFASVSAYSRSSFSGPNADFLSMEFHAGLMGSQLHSAWQVGALVRQYQLFDTPYLTEYGGRAEFSWHPDTALTWIGSFEAVGQSYHEPAIAAFVPFFISGTHDGARYDVRAGAAYRLSSMSTLTGMLGFEDKTAGYEPFAYGAPYFFAGYHQFLGSGVYLDATGEIRYVDYNKFDAFFLGVKREDLRTTARLALGTPLSAFSPAGATGDERENIILEGAVTYTGRTSRFPVAAYGSTGLELRLVWKFGNDR